MSECRGPWITGCDRWKRSRPYSNEVGSRTYKLYVPSRYRGQPLPLIIMLHGCTQSPDDFAAAPA